MDDEIRDVHDCHEHFQLPIGLVGPQLLELDPMQKRIDFIQEEFDELADAYRHQDLAKVADALVDLTYVIKGTAVMMGIDVVTWTDLWNEVHSANMRKEKTNTDDYHFGLHKPAGWKPPQIEEILEASKEHYKP
jgi:predicted HAD superfamily Cof-like phosphohydrolase